MDDLKFRVSAELKNILGRDLITSDNIAIFELVKNSYDAHATKVDITFDEDRIVIADNGKGMSLDDIINKWLFVAYSAKRDGTEDASYRSKFKRNFAGAKGIGRISCDRLARILKMTTKSEDSPTVETIILDWNKFENNQKQEFDEIPVKHASTTESFSFPDNSSTGTVLEFTQLHSDLNGAWNQDKILSLRKSLEKMINPFSDTDDFCIEIFAPQFTESDNELRAKIDQNRPYYESLTDKGKQDFANWEKSIVNGKIENSIVDILKLKTTQIESTISGDRIVTKLTDRGVEMYEIEEKNRFPKLDNATMNLYFLNRSAKHTFTIRMGIEPVNYGNIFLFRNGFRIWPYGEYDDDSWGINQRAQQGYNRFLGTRDLFGRVDVETTQVDDFKESSSRDGGLIKTEASMELMEYFSSIHRKLERYVAGVLWGEGFLRNEYFQNNDLALEVRKMLQESDKYSEDASNALKNIGSRVDFLQLVKSLVNDNAVEVKYYNADLANIVSDVSASEILQAGFFDDFRKVAEKTNDIILQSNLAAFERQIEELRKQKAEAEKKAQEEKKKAEVARKKAEEEERKRKEEEEKRQKTEKELSQKTKQNLFLLSTGSLDVDRILKYHHDIRLQSSTISNSLSRLMKLVHNQKIDIPQLLKYSELISRANSKIMSIAQFATKANFNFDGDIINADLYTYINQYVSQVLPDFYDEIKISCNTNGLQRIMDFKPLEVNLIIDNLINNSQKSKSRHFSIEISQIGNKHLISVFDDGAGLSSDLNNPDEIFEKGYTTTNGSGLGLYNVASFVQKDFAGEIHVDSKYDSGVEGFPGLKINILL